jgi:hypothetical protein
VRSGWGRAVLAIGFVGLAWFFGGQVGALVGIGLIALRLRGLGEGFFWGLGAIAVAASPLLILTQGLPRAVAGPAFAASHWLAHFAVGVALASLALAACLEVARLRRETRDRLPRSEVDDG